MGGTGTGAGAGGTGAGGTGGTGVGGVGVNLSIIGFSCGKNHATAAPINGTMIAQFSPKILSSIFSHLLRVFSVNFQYCRQLFFADGKIAKGFEHLEDEQPEP